jgi:hypothetical protein
MAEVRRVAGELAERDEVIVTQQGEPVQIAEARGPVRIVRGPAL